MALIRIPPTLQALGFSTYRENELEDAHGFLLSSYLAPTTLPPSAITISPTPLSKSFFSLQHVNQHMQSGGTCTVDFAGVTK